MHFGIIRLDLGAVDRACQGVANEAGWETGTINLIPVIRKQH
jgi:hypothetical protein